MSAEGVMDGWGCRKLAVGYRGDEDKYDDGGRVVGC